MELPDLNTAMVEVYRDLDHTTRAAKQMTCWETGPSEWELDEPDRMSLEKETGPDGSGSNPTDPV